MAADEVPDFSPSSTAEEVTDGIDATDRIAIVTGASSGLGMETARVLAMRGAEVVMGVRNITAGENVKEQILEEQSNARLHVLQLDLASNASVRRFCNDFLALNLRLNILINNAGIMGGPFILSEDGIELQFATNYVGHFLLTNLLLDNMKTTAKETGIQGRIVNVASTGHRLFVYPGGIQFDKLNDEASYASWRAYGQSKIASILHAKELARRFQEEGVNLTANAIHPGAIHTNILRQLSFSFLIQWFTSIFWKSAHQGAATQCFVALHPSLDGVSGRYFYYCKESKPSAYARDPKLAKDLWDFTENLVSSKG